MSVNLKKHFCMQVSSDINSICSKLFDYIDINHFTYINIDLKAQKRFFLSTHPEWLGYFYENSLYENKIIVQAEYFKNFNYFLWQDFEHEKPFVECKKFNLNSGITIINAGESDVNIYCYASDKQKSNDFYLLALKAFNHFIAYFHDVGDGLINDCQKHRFLCVNPEIISDSKNKNGGVEEFFSQMKVKRIYIDNEGTYLTKQEALCTYLLMFGESAKSAAKILNISNRTVESYLTFVKEKLDCLKIGQVFVKISKSTSFRQFVIFANEYFKNLESTKKF